MAFCVLYFLIINIIVFVEATTLHLVPEKKLASHKYEKETLTGNKKTDVDGLLYDSSDIANMKLLEQGVIVPDDKGLIDPHTEILNEVLKQKHGERNPDKDLPLLTVDGAGEKSTPSNDLPLTTSNAKVVPEVESGGWKSKDKELSDKKKEADAKSERIARLEKLARENLEEINILKHESLVENKEEKAEMTNKSEAAKLTDEIGPEIENRSSSNYENSQAASKNDSDLVNFIMSATNYSNLDSIASMLNDKQVPDKDHAKMMEKPEKQEIMGKFEKQIGSKGGKLEKEKSFKNKENELSSEIEKKIEAKANDFKIEAKLDDWPKIEAKNDGMENEIQIEEKSEEKENKKISKEPKHETESIESKPEESSISLQNNIIEGTMMEAEILKSNKLKPNSKVKKKKVKILILDEDEQPLKKPEHIYDSDEGIPVVASQTHVNTNEKMVGPCTLQEKIHVLEAMPHVHGNCQPMQGPEAAPSAPQPPTVPTNYGNVGTMNIQHDFRVRPLDDYAQSESFPEMHNFRHPFYHYPEYFTGYLRHKIRRKHGPHNMENIEEALQPQIHYHFNFMKDNGAHNIGTEESLVKSSLSTDWSDRKRGSFAKTPDSNAPLIDKFISFIKSPASSKRNTLTNSKNTKRDSGFSKLHSAYKRSKTARKNEKRTLSNVLNK